MNNLSALYVRRNSFPMPILSSTTSTVNQGSHSAPFNRVYWIRKEEPMHRPHKVSTKILGLGIFMVGVVLLSVGLIIGLEFPVYVSDKIIRDQCILDKDHAFYDKWSTDERWTRYNRLYYWTLDNPEEFQQGKVPRFVERGPYVYKEERQYVNVEFSGTRMSYQTKLKQTFDATLTHSECGTSCTETDNLTVLNVELIERLYRYGGWDSYIFSQLPHFIQNTINKLKQTANDETDLYNYLGCVDENCDNHGVELAQQNSCDNISISFGEFLKQSNESRAQTVTEDFKNSASTSAKVSLLKSVYQQLMRPKFDIPDSVNTCDNNGNFDFYWIVQMKDNNDPLPDAVNNASDKEEAYFRVNLTTECSLMSVTNFFTNSMLNFSDWPMANWSFSICSGDDDSCQEIEGDFETILSYFLLISEFVQLFLLQNFVGLSKSHAENQIYYTKPQKHLAVGYTEQSSGCGGVSSKVIKGILKSHSRLEEVLYTSPKLSLSTCLDQGNTDNNMIVREYNGSQFAPPSIYSDKNRRHFGFTTFLPPSDACRACAAAYPNNQTYDVFNEDLHRSIKFEEKYEVDVNGYRLFRFEVSEGSFSPNQACNLINTTSVLQYPSFVGFPYYQRSNCPIIQRLVPGSAWNHISYIEAEPWTGRIWRQRTKLQTSALITADMLGKILESSFSQVTLIEQPLPLYWVDKASEISTNEMDYFNYKIVRLMGVSCGGLIGLTTAALITMGLSFFVGLLSTRKNRIEPVPETRRPNSTTNRP